MPKARTAKRSQKPATGSESLVSERASIQVAQVSLASFALHEPRINRATREGSPAHAVVIQGTDTGARGVARVETQACLVHPIANALGIGSGVKARFTHAEFVRRQVAGDALADAAPLANW